MKYLTTKEVCSILHISRKKAYDLYKVKGFPCIQIGRDYLVDEDDLKSFMDRHKNSHIFIN